MVTRSSPVKYTDWLSIIFLALSVFTVTTTEMLPIGLLSMISNSLHASVGVTGLSVTIYGLVAGLSAPFMVKLTRSIDRRTLMLVILGVYCVGNLVTAFSGNLIVFLGSRFLIGLIHGLLWSIVANIATRLATDSDRIKATALAFSGISTALVLGVPLGTLLGSSCGWRNAFLVLSIAALANLVAMAVRMKELPVETGTAVPRMRSLLRNNRLIAALLCTTAVVIANYSAYTYVSPLLLDATRIAPGSVGVFLLFYGVAGVIGNFLAAPAIAFAGSRKRALLGMVLITSLTYALLFGVAGLAPLASILLAVWGAAYSAMPVVLQTLVLESVEVSVRESATALYVLVFNSCIALGALVGGVLVDGVGVRAPLLSALFASCLGLAAVRLLGNGTEDRV